MSYLVDHIYNNANESITVAHQGETLCQIEPGGLASVSSFNLIVPAEGEGKVRLNFTLGENPAVENLIDFFYSESDSPNIVTIHCVDDANEMVNHFDHPVSRSEVVLALREGDEAGILLVGTMDIEEPGLDKKALLKILKGKLKINRGKTEVLQGEIEVLKGQRKLLKDRIKQLKKRK